MAESLLHPDLLRRLERLELQATRRVRSTLKGERQSRARGHSVEFADYRNYVPGDDLRYLDWNLYGRLDRLYIKLYEEERELPVWIFLDASESMNFGEPRKFDFALRVAAAFGYVALCGFDRISVSVFPARRERQAVYQALYQVRGRRSAVRFLQNMAKLEPGGPARLGQTIRTAALQIRHPGTAVVISDFFDPEGYERGLGALVGRGMALVVIHVLSPEELEPTLAGDLRLVDSETGEVQEVTFGRFRLKAYQRTLERFCGGLESWCLARGAHYLRCSSADPLEEVLLKKLVRLGVWR